MKAWLKGGLIGVSIVFILFILMFLIEMSMGIKSDMGTPSIWIFFVIPALPLILLTSFLKIPTVISNILMIIIPIFEFFIIGAIVGLIISKIKSRKPAK